MKSKNKNFDNYDDEIEDTDELKGNDITINPQFYMHNAFLKAQNALIKDNLSEGLVQFRFLVEHIETIARSAGLLPEDYEALITEFKEKEEYSNSTDQQAKNILLANKKVELIFKELFGTTGTMGKLKC